MFRYWISVIKEAHRRSWRAIFVDWRSVVGHVVVVGIAAFVLHQAGRSVQVIDELNWFVATVIALVLLYGAVFVFHVLRTPSVREESNLSEIDRLKNAVSATEKGSAPSFDLFLDQIEIPRSDFGWGEIKPPPQKICRLGITNIDNCAFDGCRIVVESVMPATAVVAGTVIVDDFRISSTETTFFALVKTAAWGGESVGLSARYEDEILIPERTRLPAGETYSICVAVHGIDANTRRLQFQCKVDTEGFTIIDHEKHVRAGESVGTR